MEMSELVAVKVGIRRDVLGLNTVSIKYAANISMGAQTYTRLKPKSNKISHQSCSQQKELRKKRWKTGSKRSV